MRGLLDEWQHGDGAQERGEWNDGPCRQVHSGGRGVRGTATTYVIHGISGADGVGGMYGDGRTHERAG